MRRIRVVLPALAAIALLVSPAVAQDSRRWPLDPRTGTVEVFDDTVTCPDDGWTFTVGVHLAQGDHSAEVRETVDCTSPGEVIPLVVRTSTADGRFHSGTATTGESYIWCRPPDGQGPPCTGGSFGSQVDLVPSPSGRSD